MEEQGGQQIEQRLGLDTGFHKLTSGFKQNRWAGKRDAKHNKHTACACDYRQADAITDAQQGATRGGPNLPALVLLPSRSLCFWLPSARTRLQRRPVQQWQKAPAGKCVRSLELSVTGHVWGVSAEKPNRSGRSGGVSTVIPRLLIVHGTRNNEVGVTSLIAWHALVLHLPDTTPGWTRTSLLFGVLQGQNMSFSDSVL
eukprot:5709360-Amphidinium_carterae.1